MLFKNLKAIMNEADEAAAPPADAAPADGTAVPPTTPVKLKRKPAAVDKVADEASDGVGHEAYEVSNTLALSLYAILKEIFGGGVLSVNANKNLIIVGLTKDNKIKPESILAGIEQIIFADMGDKKDDFVLQPTPITNSKLAIAVIPVEKPEIPVK